MNIKITTESLTNMRFQPRKNYDTNEMEAGMFQMLDGTNIICDETSLNPGKMEGNAVNNIKALAEVIEDQKVVYDFQYVQQDFPVSASVLILSTTRSMFQNALHIPAKCDQESSEYEMTDDKFGQILADSELLQQLRRYFMMLTHYSELTLE